MGRPKGSVNTLKKTKPNPVGRPKGTSAKPKPVGRPKGTSSKSKITGNTGLSKSTKNTPLLAVPIAKAYKCTAICGNSYDDQVKNFYNSNSLIVKNNNGRMTICKECIVKIYEFLVAKYNYNYKLALYFVCSMCDVYFDASLYPAVEQQAINTGSIIVKTYFQKINSLPQYSSKTFADSTLLDVSAEIKVDNPLNLPVLAAPLPVPKKSDEDLQNREDVIRMVGYDPFENESLVDQKDLHNKLVDFLDESTLEDSFKLPIVIEIVKSFSQIDKLNQALANVMIDPTTMVAQSGSIKVLLETKDKMLRSILAMAKDNGISVAHAMNKSQGAGTLSGIIKKLQELGFEDSNVNLYDIETCDGMKQVADISNRSILEQIMLDENDYTQMIAEQRGMIQSLDSENIKVKEELRLLKIMEKRNAILEMDGDGH